MNNGWIKLHRQIQESWLWNDEPYDKARAWIDLIMLANYENDKIAYKGELIECKRGTVNRSIKSLSERWGWGREKTINFLRLLEKDGMIVINATTHRTTITIVNYDKFQDYPTTNPTTNQTTDSTTSRQQTVQPTVQPTVHIEEDKEYKEKKESKELKKNNIRRFPNDDLLEEAFIDFSEMRKKIKKPLTDRAADMVIKKLNELSTNNSGVMDNDVAIKILNQSTMNCWQGLFPLKDNITVNKNNGIDWSKI